MMISQTSWGIACKGFALSALLVLAPLQALAEKADKQKPINLEADSLRYDDVKQITIVEGSVTLTKGTIVMRGQRIEVREDELGNQFSAATAKPNERAFFRQKREGLDEFMEGEAERIEFDGKQDMVKLIGKAVMRRFRGATLADESVGSTIVFNNLTETLTVNGAPASAATPGQRVRMMLSPKEDKTSQPTGNVPSPQLRPAPNTQNIRN